jgi:hypothetical protein
MFNFDSNNANIKIPRRHGKISARSLGSMRSATIALVLFLTTAFGVFAQPLQSQEVSEGDGIPVLLKNLPEWESVRDQAVLIKNQNELKNALGERPVFDLIDFAGGTEAATAPYEAGRLLIVEYNTPQFSIDADNKIKERLAQIGQNPPIYYRRIGNYNVFVFDAADEAAADELLGQVKYGKIVQWLGEDPFLYERAERHYARTLSELFISTVLWIVSGFGISVLLGVGVGAVFFYFRKRQRETWNRFSDAGGMLRLNLDDLQEPRTDRLLKD